MSNQNEDKERGRMMPGQESYFNIPEWDIELPEWEALQIDWDLKLPEWKLEAPCKDEELPEGQDY